jgi:PAS domain S-box-containing protein
LLILKYLEPEATHADLLGLDEGADPERRWAAEKARDTGSAVISAPVNLQGTEAGGRNGLLMMLPVYRNGAPTETLMQRRANIKGWVLARFITAQLMDGALGKKAGMVRFEVLDRGAGGELTPLFDTATAAGPGRNNYSSTFTSTGSVAAGQRLWLLRFTATPEFDASISHGLELLVAAGGGLISLLLFGIALSLSSTRASAVAMANEMTTAFREANTRLQKEIQEREYIEQRTAIQHSVTRWLAEADTLAEATPRIVQAVCESLGWDFGALWRVDANTDHLHCVAIWHRPGADAEEFAAVTREATFQKGAGLPGRIWADGEPVWIKDVAGDKNFPRAPFAAKAGLHAAFGFPLLLGDEFLGMVEFYSHRIVEPDAELLKLVAALGSQIGQFIKRRRAQKELEHEQFLLRTLMDSLPDRIYFKDLQSRFLRTNRAHMKRCGIADPRDAIGRSDFDFFAKDSAQRTYQDEQEVIRTGQALNKEEKTATASGHETWALITKMPMRNERGEIIGTFGISRDITDRKRAEEAMRIAKEAAEEASRTKSQFLANMSHELRTPLNSVIGFAGILLKNKNGNLLPNELNFLDRIQANGKHLLSLINQILDLSKIEARKVELQLAPVALDALVRETIAQQEGLVRDRPVQLIADVPETVALIPVDAEKLRQVIINLIGNALKFTERGSVTVRVVTNLNDHKPVQIDVMDTGIGIPKEKLGVIFEAFQQADASTARKYGGTGLGLTISQALCELMDYHIEVASEVGQGSTFSVILCRRDQRPAGSGSDGPELKAKTGAAAVVRPPSDLHGKLVLVIDDESDSRILLTHMLEEFGCQVIAANSGEQGLRMAREFRPQIITVDLLMPHMDGAAVVRAIKADPQARDIPLVVVSIVAEERRRSILGTVDILEKPVTREDLLNALGRSKLPANPKILVVDDESDAREIIRSQLADKPVQISMAANGREALACLEKAPQDLVVLDLIMPVMDGLSFLDAIRADPRYQQLPVVIVSSKPLSPLEKEQLRMQKLEFVKKAELSEESFRFLLQRILQQADGARPKTGQPAP